MIKTDEWASDFLKLLSKRCWQRNFKMSDRLIEIRNITATPMVVSASRNWIKPRLLWWSVLVFCGRDENRAKKTDTIKLGQPAGTAGNLTLKLLQVYWILSTRALTSVHCPNSPASNRPVSSPRMLFRSDIRQEMSLASNCRVCPYQTT